MKDAMQQFPTRSAMKHVLAPNISDRSVRRVLKFYLKMPPYKMLVTKCDAPVKSNVLKCNNRFCLLKTYCLSDEAHFLLCGVLTNNICAIGLKLILKNCMNVHYIALKFLSGVQSPSYRYGVFVFL